MAKIAVFENVMAKNKKCFNIGTLCNHKGLKIFRRQCIFVENVWLCQISTFLLYNENFGHELKIACNNLFFFILEKLTTIYFNQGVSNTRPVGHM